jgi:hypothetical protein
VLARAPEKVQAALVACHFASRTAPTDLPALSIGDKGGPIGQG